MRRCLPQQTSKQEGGGGVRAKTAKATALKDNVSKMIDFCESAVKLLKSC